MDRPRYTWQGIGVSSNPFRGGEPLSLHLLAYLREASGLSGYHTLIVADTIQETNYQALNWLGEGQARKTARAKGRRKASRLRKVCRADGLGNIGIRRFDQVFRKRERGVLDELVEAYNYDSGTREQVRSLIPDRLRGRGDQDLLARYALKELSLILSLPGVKFGHEGERKYDEAAMDMHLRHGIGRWPEFLYSSLPLELIPDTGLMVEPYSSLEAGSRLLLTDSPARFRGKVGSLKPRERDRLRRHLTETWGPAGEDLERLYQDTAGPIYSRFRRPGRIGKIAASLAVAVGVTIGASLHVDADCQRIRQEKISQIPVFVFTGPDVELCYKAVRDATQEANREIREKWGIPQYFRLDRG